MFARNVSANLKPGTLAKFTETMENEIVPWLRKKKGFLDVITLAVPGGREVVAISFWDQKGNAGLQFNGLSRGVEDPGKTTERHEGGG
jgi:hypothetical protein